MTQKAYDDGEALSVLFTCDRCGAQDWDAWDTWSFQEARDHGPDYCPRCLPPGVKPGWAVTALALVLVLFAGACAAPPRQLPRAADAATREAAHRELIQELRIQQVLGYGWRYKTR